MSSQQERGSYFGAVLEWCRDRWQANSSRPRSAESMPGVVEQTKDDCELPAPPRYFLDASLLFRCMDKLQIDRSDLARSDPLLFRELQGVCALCPEKEQCAQDLGHEFDDARWNKWRACCPNSAILSMIGAAQNCGRAAQHFKMSHAGDLSRLR